MANEPEHPVTDKQEPLHFAQIVDAPNRYGVRSSVRLGVAINQAEGDSLREVVVNLDLCCLPAGLADEFRRDPEARPRVEAEVARAAANEFMRRDRRVIWRGERLD